jgi:hypothetical protein
MHSTRLAPELSATPNTVFCLNHFALPFRCSFNFYELSPFWLNLAATFSMQKLWYWLGLLEQLLLTVPTTTQRLVLLKWSWFVRIFTWSPTLRDLGFVMSYEFFGHGDYFSIKRMDHTADLHEQLLSWSILSLTTTPVSCFSQSNFVICYLAVAILQYPVFLE